MTTDKHHLTNPVDQAAKDYAEGLDIGHNPFPFKSAYWHKYRVAHACCYQTQLESEYSDSGTMTSADHIDPVEEGNAPIRQGGEV